MIKLGRWLACSFERGSLFIDFQFLCCGCYNAFESNILLVQLALALRSYPQLVELSEDWKVIIWKKREERKCHRGLQLSPRVHLSMYLDEKYLRVVSLVPKRTWEESCATGIVLRTKTTWHQLFLRSKKNSKDASKKNRRWVPPLIENIPIWPITDRHEATLTEIKESVALGK